MDHYKNLSEDLGNILLSVPLIAKIGKYSVYILGVSFLFIFLSAFTIPFGGFLSTLFYYSFLFSSLLCFVNYQNTYLLMGLWGYALTRIIALLFGFSWSNLASLILFAFLGYMVFKKIGEIKLNG